MQAYSQDLRKRIVQAVKTTGNQTQVAITFQVSRSSVKRFLKLEELDQTLAPKKRPGRQRGIAVEDFPQVIAFLEAKNDLTLAELAQLWQEHYHQKLSISNFSVCWRRLAGSEKKEYGSLRTR